MHEIELHPPAHVAPRALATALVPLGLVARAGVIHLQVDDAPSWEASLRVDREPLLLTVPRLDDLASRQVRAVLRVLAGLGYVAHEEGDGEPMPWARLLPPRQGDLDPPMPDKLATASTAPGLVAHAKHAAPPATPGQLAELGAAVATPLPSLVVDVLRAANGMQIGAWQFYATTEIAERNHTWGVLEEAPGWLALADDGGGRILVAHGEDPQLHLAYASSPTERTLLADDGRDWLAAGAPDLPHSDIEASAPGEVFALRAVVALRDIRALRTAFAVDQPLHVFAARLRTEAAPHIGTTSLARARLAAAKLPPALATTLVFQAASGERSPLGAPPP